MYENHTVGVVVTAYNENGHVGEVIDTMPEFVDRVYVVDDGSTDGTWAEIRRHAARANADPIDDPPLTATGVELAPRVVPIRHERNTGVGGAMKTGYRRARADGVGVVASMDGDGQMDPAELSRILDPVIEGRVGYAKGNRLWYRDSRRGMSRWRLFGNAVLSLLTKASSGYWGMADPQNGYTAISRDVLAAIPLEQLTDDYGFLNDLLATLNIYDVPIADVAHRAKYADEQSHIRYSRFVPGLSWLLLRNFLRRLKLKYLVFDFHPVVIGYAFGTAAVGAGLVLAVSAVSAAAGTGNGVLRGAAALIVFFLAGVLLVLSLALDVERNDDLVLRVHAPVAGRRPGEIPPGHPAITASREDDRAEPSPVLSSDGGSHDEAMVAGQSPDQ